MHRDVAGVGITLEQIEQRESIHVGQADIERDGIGTEAAGER